MHRRPGSLSSPQVQLSHFQGHRLSSQVSQQGAAPGHPTTTCCNKWTIPLFNSYLAKHPREAVAGELKNQLRPNWGLSPKFWRRNRSHTEYLIRQREEFNNSFNSKRFASVCKSFFNGNFNDKRFAKASSPQKNHNLPISPFEKNQPKLGKCESKPQDTTLHPLEQLLFKA